MAIFCRSTSQPDLPPPPPPQRIPSLRESALASELAPSEEGEAGEEGAGGTVGEGLVDWGEPRS